VSRFLDALDGKNMSYPPVWFMRQAGRYAPSYQEIRRSHSLLEMFKNPHLAAKITCLPFQDLDLDAAIIFSDILVVFEALGFSVDYPMSGGPKVCAPKTVREILDTLSVKDVKTSLSYVFESIRLVKPNLKVPLIGFSGSPFTLLAYLLEKPMTDEIKSVKKALYETPDETEKLLEIITEILKEFAALQIKAGADAFQIFDTASTWLSDEAFKRFSFHYTKKLVDHLKSLNIKTLLFSKSSSARIEHYNKLPLSMLSVDWTSSIKKLRHMLNPSIGLQGNLDPFLTTLDYSFIENEVNCLLDETKGMSNFIFNLGHGVYPETKLESLQKIIEAIKATLPLEKR
jgi:uroporphyrinogen decarboxylase